MSKVSGNTPLSTRKRGQIYQEIFNKNIEVDEGSSIERELENRDIVENINELNSEAYKGEVPQRDWDILQKYENGYIVKLDLRGEPPAYAGVYTEESNNKIKIANSRHGAEDKRRLSSNESKTQGRDERPHTKSEKRDDSQQEDKGIGYASIERMFSDMEQFFRKNYHQVEKDNQSGYRTLRGSDSLRGGIHSVKWVCITHMDHTREDEIITVGFKNDGIAGTFDEKMKFNINDVTREQLQSAVENYLSPVDKTKADSTTDSTTNIKHGHKPDKHKRDSRTRDTGYENSDQEEASEDDKIESDISKENFKIVVVSHLIGDLNVSTENMIDEDYERIIAGYPEMKDVLKRVNSVQDLYEIKNDIPVDIDDYDIKNIENAVNEVKNNKNQEGRIKLRSLFN